MIKMRNIYINLSNQKYSLVLFIFWPFLSLIYAFRSYKEFWVKNIIWLYSIYYGYTFIPVDTLDGYRYKRNFMIESGKIKSWERFFEIFEPNQYGEKLDYFQDIINFVVSSFTDDYHILFAIYGMIFGYFYSRNIDFTLKRFNGKINYWTFPFLFLTIIYVGIWEINGVRFWTATHVFGYFILHYFNNPKLKYVFGLSIAPLVHFSFIIPFLLFIVNIFIKERIKIFYIIFLISNVFLVTPLHFSSETINEYVSERYEGKVTDYNDEKNKSLVMEKRINNRSIPYRMQNTLMSLYVIVLSILFMKLRTYIKSKINRAWTLGLMSFTFMILSVVNILSSIPSFGRFLIVGYFIFFTVILINLADILKSVKNIKLLISFSFLQILFFFIVKVGLIIGSTSIMAFIGNPIVSIFVSDDTLSLFIIIKYFLT